MIGQIGAAAIVPFGIGQVRVRGASHRGLPAADRDRIRAWLAGLPLRRPSVISSRSSAAFSRILVLSVVGRAVDIDHLGHREDLLEAVEHERIARGRSVLALADGETLAHRPAALARVGPACVVTRMSRGAALACPAIAPQRAWQDRLIAGRRLGRQRRRPDHGRPQLARRRRIGAEQRKHDLLHLLLDARQRPARPRHGRGRGEPGVGFGKAGTLRRAQAPRSRWPGARSADRAAADRPRAITSTGAKANQAASQR